MAFRRGRRGRPMRRGRFKARRPMRRRRGKSVRPLRIGYRM